MSKDKLCETFRKPEELLRKTVLNITRKSVSLETNYKERLLHSHHVFPAVFIENIHLLFSK